MPTEGAARLLTGEQIVEGRKKLSWTQEDLARAANVGIASIKRWETGQIQTKAMDDILRRVLAGKRRLLTPTPETGPCRWPGSSWCWSVSAGSLAGSS